MAKLKKTSTTSSRSAEKRMRAKKKFPKAFRKIKILGREDDLASPSKNRHLHITVEAKQDINGTEIRILRFGAVTVSNTAPDARTVVKNVKAGRDALGRAKEALINPGVKLAHRASIPKFRVDAHDPRILIREVDGRVERGRIVSGTFLAAE